MAVSRKRASSPWGILGAAVTAQTAVSLTEQGVPTLTGFIKEDLALSAAVAGLLTASMSVGKMLGGYPAGSAVDRLGERRVLFVGALGTGVLVAAAAGAPIVLLVVLLVVAGVCAATPTPAGSKIVLVAFPISRRGLAMGLRQSAIPLGGLLAALTLPWAANEWGWRASLALAGAVTVAGAIVAFAAAGVETRDERRVQAAAARKESRGLLSFARDRDIALLTLWGMLLVGGQFVIIAFLPVAVHEGGRISLPAAVLLVAIAQAGGIAGRIAWGLLADRLRRRRPVMLAITVTGIASAALLAVLPERSSFAEFSVAAFLAGVSVIGWQGVWMTSISEFAGAGLAGSVTGFGLMFVWGASAWSPPLYGLVADVTGSYRVMWLALAAALIVSLIPVLLGREPDQVDMSIMSDI